MARNLQYERALAEALDNARWCATPEQRALFSAAFREGWNARVDDDTTIVVSRDYLLSLERRAWVRKR